MNYTINYYIKTQLRDDTCDPNLNRNLYFIYIYFLLRKLFSIILCYITLKYLNIKRKKISTFSNLVLHDLFLQMQKV